MEDDSKASMNEDHASASAVLISSPLYQTPEIEPECSSMLFSDSAKAIRRSQKRSGSDVKRRAREKKLRVLRENFNPIRFTPVRILEFSSHEQLLKKLGLWDFVQFKFDQTIRADLVSELIVSYSPKSCSASVNGRLFYVHRAALRRALSLPGKISKLDESSDCEASPLPQESISFLENFVSNWFLLHGDMWVIPKEILFLTQLIRDGYPEKVDWAGLLWIMMKKELMKRSRLENCYYASHFQCLMKSQWPAIFTAVDIVEMEPTIGLKSAEDDDIEMTYAEGEVEEDGGMVKVIKSLDFHEKEKEKARYSEIISSKNKGEARVIEENSLLRVKCNGNDQYLHPCSRLDEFVSMGDDDGGRTEEILQKELKGHVGNKEQSHVHEGISLCSNVTHMGLRGNTSLEDNPSNLELCMGNIQEWVGKARMLCMEKEAACAEMSMTQQFLISELQQRDSVIKHLQETKCEDLRKKESENYQLERELFIMTELLESYRRALKETQRAFTECRCQQSMVNEPICKNVVQSGGLVLSTVEIERHQQKQEEEETAKCLFIEKRACDFETTWMNKFKEHLVDVDLLDCKLHILENDLGIIKEFYVKMKV